MRFVIPSLVAVAIVGFASAQPEAAELPANPPSVRLPEPRTNARRFAVGLPPLPPKHRHRSDTPHGGSQADTARRAVASPSLPIVTRCNLLVKNSASGAIAGYITAKPKSDTYNQLQSGQVGALEASFSYSLDDASPFSQMDLLVTDDTSINPTYPYFGAIAGSTSNTEVSSTSADSLYIGGTTQTSKGSRPVQGTSTLNAQVNRLSKAESAIWKFDPITREFTAQWINSDGSSPPVYLVRGYQNNLWLTGNVSKLNQAIGGGMNQMTLTCVTPLPA